MHIYINHIIIPQVYSIWENLPHIFRQSQGRTPRAAGSEGFGCDHIDGQRLRRDCGGCRVEGLGRKMALGRKVGVGPCQAYGDVIYVIYIYM